MTLSRNVAEIIRQHVTLEVESIDRMYLNIYVPDLQRAQGVLSFFRYNRGKSFASSTLMGEMTKSFVAALESFITKQKIPVVNFEKGQRKDDIAAAYRAKFTGDEGILFIGKAQEKASVFRTEKRRNGQTGQSYPWLQRSTAIVNHYYIYAIDRDFGPFFLKFCSYFPYNAKLCLNGHEWAKRQLAHRGIAFEPLDNGFLSCADPSRLQQICDSLSPDKIDRLLRKWFRMLPHPFTAQDRRAEYRYDISVLQAEFALTQVLDRPLTGRAFFEEVIHENLDLGHPGQVQLIFQRRVTKRTPGLFRTRIITQEVTPSLHIDYKHSRIKQYHKEGRALRTETTINRTYDFDIGKRLKNLPRLRQVGFTANRRLLDVQQVSHDCAIGEAAFQQVQRPVAVAGQRASAIRFGDQPAQTVLHALLLLTILPRGFQHKHFKERFAQLLGLDPSQITQGKMSYQLRRLRLHGLIERQTGTHRYLVTGFGLRMALFYTRSYRCLLRPALSHIMQPESFGNSELRLSFDHAERAIQNWCHEVKLAA